MSPLAKHAAGHGGYLIGVDPMRLASSDGIVAQRAVLVK
jgi:hypothetical protein